MQKGVLLEKYFNKMDRGGEFILPCLNELP